MKIGGFIASSLIDYPDKIAAVIFFRGCNFRCPYCHNSWLLEKKEKSISLSYILDFLKKRIGKLDGVVLSGGEPTIQSNLKNVIEKIKNLGYPVKLDTNGYKPETIAKLLNGNLLDYIAMDIKGPFYKYGKITNSDIKIEKIKQSINIIKSSRIDYEFRTTVVKSLLTENDILTCGKHIKGAKTYYLQKFNHNNNTLDKNFKKEETYSDEELKKIIGKLKFNVKNSAFR